MGLLGGVLVLCTIGFFILLGLVLDGKANLGEEALAAQPSADAVAPSAPSPTPAPPPDAGVGDVKPIGEDEHILGSANAAVSLISYTDIECPFCGRFHPTLEKAVEEFDGQVKATVRHFPLSFHQNARSAANAAECAGEQGKYFEFLHELFANQGGLGTDFYDEVAGDLGLNASKFGDCVASEKYDDKISADMSSGLAAGVKGTPGTIIVGPNGDPQLVPGAVPYEQLKAMIEAAL